MCTPRFGLFLSLAVAALMGLPQTAAATPLLQTYVIAVGGQSTLIPPFGCATFGPPAASGDFFSSAGVGGGVSIPTDGLATCGVAGGFNAKSATVGPLADSASVTTGFNSGANTFSGSADVNAQYGKVGAESHSTSTGPVNSMIVYGSEGQSIFRDTLTITSPTVANGTPGQIIYSFTVDGSMSATGLGTSLFDVVYEQNGGPNFTLMRASADPRFAGPFITATDPTGLAGFTISEVPGVSQSISGSGEFDTFSLDFVYGTPFDFALGLRSWASPAISSNDVDFSSSALMTGIGVFAGGQGLTDFVIGSGSGTRYNANGVQLDQNGEVPEPGSLAILSAGLLGLSLLFRRRAGMAA